MGQPPMNQSMGYTTTIGGSSSAIPPPSNYSNDPAYIKEMQYKNQYGSQPMVGGGVSAASGPPSILNSLRRCVQDKKLHRFYNDAKLQQLANQLAAQEPVVRVMCREWAVPDDVVFDLYKLALYDIVFLCDDSGSMVFEEKGERVDDLKMVLSYAARAASIFDDDGISVRFLNSNVSGDGIKSAAQVESLIKPNMFCGPTPLGTALENKVLNPHFYQPYQSNSLHKPLLVIIITDGTPAGEPRDYFEQVLSKVYRSSNGGEGIAIAVAQVGTDQNAQSFLGELDRKSPFGVMVDVTSNFELEQTELMRKGLNLTPAMWVCKLLLGAIDPSYDEQDE